MEVDEPARDRFLSEEEEELPGMSWWRTADSGNKTSRKRSSEDRLCPDVTWTSQELIDFHWSGLHCREETNSTSELSRVFTVSTHTLAESCMQVIKGAVHFIYHHQGQSLSLDGSCTPGHS